MFLSIFVVGQCRYTARLVVGESLFIYPMEDKAFICHRIEPLSVVRRHCVSICRAKEGVTWGVFWDGIFFCLLWL